MGWGWTLWLSRTLCTRRRAMWGGLGRQHTHTPVIHTCMSSGTCVCVCSGVSYALPLTIHPNLLKCTWCGEGLRHTHRTTHTDVAVCEWAQCVCERDTVTASNGDAVCPLLTAEVECLEAGHVPCCHRIAHCHCAVVAECLVDCTTHTPHVTTTHTIHPSTHEPLRSSTSNVLLSFSANSAFHPSALTPSSVHTTSSHTHAHHTSLT